MRSILSGEGHAKLIGSPVTGCANARPAACSATPPSASTSRRAPGRRPARRAGPVGRRRPGADGRARPGGPGSGGSGRSRAGTRESHVDAAAEALEHPIAGDRPLAPALGHDRHAHPGARIAADRRVDHPLRRGAARPGRARGSAGSPCGAASCAVSPSYAAWVLASTSSPEVSLSRRWTIPGRRAPPTPAISGAWASAAAASVPSMRPRRDGSTMPAGLSTTSTCASS